jgi:hypothetical protein
MFLKPKDLEKVSVGGLLSVVANAGLGLVLSCHKRVRRYNGTVMIWALLGSAMEPCTTTFEDDDILLPEYVRI